MNIQAIIKEGASVYESKRRAEQHVSGNEQLLFDACAGLKQLQADNKRLREALERIAKLRGMKDTYKETAIVIAEQALKQE